jgi:hypothetical protein
MFASDCWVLLIVCPVFVHSGGNAYHEHLERFKANLRGVYPPYQRLLTWNKNTTPPPPKALSLKVEAILEHQHRYLANRRC